MKLLVTTSTFPANHTDPVPAFVKEQVIWMKRLHPDLTVHILAPHSSYSRTNNITKHDDFTEHRFHYFLPHRWEKLAGRGIQPALKENKLLYLLIPFLVVFQTISTYRLVRKLKPDVIYAHWFTPQAITAAFVARVTGTKFAFYTHASDVIVLKSLPFSKNLVAWVCKQAFFYAASSVQTATKLRYFETNKTRDAIEAKLHIVPMGASFSEASTTTIRNTRKELGIQDDEQVILFMGRLVDRKGIDILIDAFSILAARHPDIKLVIAGDGQERLKFVEQAHNLQLGKRVIFAGYVSGDRKAALHTISDVTCVPSVNVGHNSEGLPVVFMEATIYNTVTVVSNVTGAHETVTSGKDSFVFQEKSVPDLVDALDKALSVAHDDAFLKRVKKLSNKFRWEHVAEEHYRLLASYQKNNK